MPTLPRGRRDFESFLEAWSLRIAKDLGVDPALAIPTIGAAIERLSPHLGPLAEDAHSGSVSIRPQALFNALAASLADPSTSPHPMFPLIESPERLVAKCEAIGMGLYIRGYFASRDVLAAMPREVAERYHAAPLIKRLGRLVVVMADPWNESALKDLRFLTGMEIDPICAPAADIAAYIEREYAAAVSNPSDTLPASDVLIATGTIDQIARHFGLQVITPGEFKPNPELMAHVPNETSDETLLACVPLEMAREKRVVPVRRKGCVLILGMVDPRDVSTMYYVKYRTTLDVEPLIVHRSEIDAMIDRQYSATPAPAD